MTGETIRAELADWLPETIFDAHVHLGPPEAMGGISRERSREPLCTFPSFVWEEAAAAYREIFPGRRIVGLFAFGFPLREADLDRANGYIAGLMRSRPEVKGFLLAHPTDAGRTVRAYERARKNDIRFRGVKPYFDFLGKSNYESAMPEFIPEELLRFMNREKLILMLHTSGVGMGDPENRRFVLSLLDRHPDIPVILAHMGRFLEPAQFRAFLESGAAEHPRVYLEMSSVTDAGVYRGVLERERLHDRLLFGTDLPFGLITGVEYWSPETGPTFLTRDTYSWSNVELNRRFAHITRTLTHNTCHVVKALKDALADLSFPPAAEAAIKMKIFRENALGM